jgi:CRP-like cAMP-binding protein
MQACDTNSYNKAPFGGLVLHSTQCALFPALNRPPMACLPVAEREDLEQWVFPRRLATREALFRPGQWPAFVHVLREGSLKLVREDAGQGATVVETAQPGDWIGVSWTLRNEPYSVLAEALEPSAVCSLRSEDFLRHFSGNPEFNLAVSRQISAKLESAQSMLWLRSRHDAASRLAACLLHLDGQRPKDAPPGVLLTKSDLGQIIATAQETVFRLLTKFESRGLLRREERRILLTNRTGLQAVADSARNTGPGKSA